MPLVTSRIPFNPQNPYRSKRPTTGKIIFLSLEGSVTEEEYFECISDLFSEIKSKIQFISVAENAVHTASKYRTDDQDKLLSKVRPRQLVERIDQFRNENDSIYQFSKWPDDEFWIVVDVDKNWSNDVINRSTGKTYFDEWNEAIAMCHQKGYGYAVSNPFFEMWLLLHHDEPTEEDRSFAVTDSHRYERTDHFRTRLNDLNVPLKDKKHIDPLDYSDQKVRDAIQRANKLHTDKNDLCPKYYATTVYLLLQKIVQMLPNQTQPTAIIDS